MDIITLLGCLVVVSFLNFLFNKLSKSNIKMMMTDKNGNVIKSLSRKDIDLIEKRRREERRLKNEKCLEEIDLVIDVNDDNLKELFYKEVIENNYDFDVAVVNVLEKVLIHPLKEKYNFIKKANFTMSFNTPSIWVAYYPLIGNVHKKSNIIYKKLLEVGLPVQCIRFELLLKEPLFISDIKINSKYITQYASHQDFFDRNANAKYTKYWIQCNLLYFLPELFKYMFNVSNCTCTNLLPVFELDPPLIYECSICGKKYACECQKEYYDVITKGLKECVNGKDKVLAYNNKSAYDRYTSFEYKKGICFICKKEVPPAKFYSNDATEFALRYAPYIKAREKAYFNGYKFDEKFSYLDVSYSVIKEVHNKSENEIRELVGYPLIGEKWINETTLYKIIKMLYPNYTIIREYSPDWLNKQRIDIFIKELNIAVEYQGEQHFKPIKHFGGEEGLIKTQERDKIKAKLCKKNNVKLVYFDYEETLSEKLVKQKIEN